MEGFFLKIDIGKNKIFRHRDSRHRQFGTLHRPCSGVVNFENFQFFCPLRLPERKRVESRSQDDALRDAAKHRCGEPVFRKA